MNENSIGVITIAGKEWNAPLPVVTHIMELRDSLEAAYHEDAALGEHNIIPSLRAEIVELRAALAKEKQENLDHAEDWALCGIPKDSLLTEALVLRDKVRKLTDSLREAVEDKDRFVAQIKSEAAEYKRLFDALFEIEGLVQSDPGNTPAWVDEIIQAVQKMVGVKKDGELKNE